MTDREYMKANAHAITKAELIAMQRLFFDVIADHRTALGAASVKLYVESLEVLDRLIARTPDGDRL